MREQLTFDLPAKTALGRDDFFVVPSNTLAVKALEGWRNWPGARMMLWGPKGSGKTHLAHVWAADTGAAIVSAADIDEAAAGRLGLNRFLVVEDADAIAGDKARETALFHLYNLIQSKGGRLLMTAELPPSRWPVLLADLQSRMQAMPLAKLDAPDDALLAALMIKLFADRQIAIGPELIPYLLDRIERSPDAVTQVVEALDRAALTQKRAVNRRLAAEVLDKGGRGKA